MTAETRPAGFEPATVETMSPRFIEAADLKPLEGQALVDACATVRDTVIDTVSKIGGHLGSSLGVVELTVALHKVFDTPADKLVWDVSHQCYPHKLLTGRGPELHTLRQGGGLAGFTCRDESEHDCFGAAHSSTAISAGLGFAAARDFQSEDYSVVAIVGDGALSGGMAFEGLNNLGATRHRMIVILNDNDMSISPPAGALADHLRDLAARAFRGSRREDAIKADPLAKLVDAPTLFEGFNLRYAGPFDGHDVLEMTRVLDAAKACDEPIVLHVRTVKGKGYAPAEASADCYHGVTPFDVSSGKQNKPSGAPPDCATVFSKALVKLAETDPKIVVVTPAMAAGSKLTIFEDAYPDRLFDAGIAEQHAVTFAAGLAAGGMKPFASIYSTFLQRGYDQVVHDVAIQRLPVRFAIDRAGLVGADGVTHQGAYDIAYLGVLPHFVLMAAASEPELAAMAATAALIDDAPSAVRYPRGALMGLPAPDAVEPLEIGKGRIVREGTDAAILSYGGRLADALGAADLLSKQGVELTVADARFAKPIDVDLAIRLFEEHAVVFSVEEGSLGGFSSLLMHALHEAGRGELMARYVPVYLPDGFIFHDKPARQIEIAGLDAGAIAARVQAALGRPRLAKAALAGE